MSVVKIELAGNIMAISLNRPEKRNAFDQQMIKELTEAFQQAKNEAGARVVVIKGEGESFSAGADLNYMKSMAGFSLKENQADSMRLFEMYQAMEAIPCPVVGLVQGHVMGGALGIVALCDVVAAEKETKFCFSEVKLGLAPAVVSQFVAKKINRSQLTRWFLTGEVFSAKKAKHMGLVHMTGHGLETAEFVAQVTAKISNNGPQAIRATKELLGKLYNGENNFSDYSVKLIAQLRSSSEGQEGLKAFFEKRSPQWNK